MEDIEIREFPFRVNKLWKLVFVLKQSVGDYGDTDRGNKFINVSRLLQSDRTLSEIRVRSKENR